MKIFLSHRGRDKALVREFKSMLPSFLHAWLDEESLSWGERFPDTLERTIRSDADFVVIFLDKDTLRSKWVVQELEWARRREQKLKRTFVLPILLDDVAPNELPEGFSERISLRLNDYNHSTVEELARRATLKLFQLVADNYAALQARSFPARLVTLRRELTPGQSKLLGYLVDECRSGRSISQTRIQELMGARYGASEVYYRLESLVLQGFVSKRHEPSARDNYYRLTDAFRELLSEEV
jgi:DNA-binding MarR family transcriptional regulator